MSGVLNMMVGSNALASQHVLTVGTQGDGDFGYQSPSPSFGNLVPNTTPIIGGATILMAYWKGGVVTFGLAGLRPNSGWSKLTVGTMYLLRSDGDYSQVTIAGFTRWQWTVASNPFGTTIGATVPLVIT